MSHHLLVEKVETSDFKYIIEEENSKGPTQMFIEGPYMVAEEVNQNKRMYPLEMMREEVARYITEMVETKRAMGELNHPTSAEVDLKNTCHLVTKLTNEDNVVIGKSKVLSTPSGLIVQSLIRDGVSVGMSSRALGQLHESDDEPGVNTVKDMRLVAIDCVADPSYPKAFVNGILESKQWVLANNGQFEQLYEDLEHGIRDLPVRDVDQYLRNQITDFLTKLKTI